MDSHIRRAIAAYFKYTDMPVQPSDADSYVTVVEGRQYVVLANVNGLLAVYRVDPSDRLKRLKRWPEGVLTEALAD